MPCPTGSGAIWDNGLLPFSCFALFVVSALYAVLHYLGLQRERRRLIGSGAPSTPSRLQDWIDFLSGHDQADAEWVAARLSRWPDQTQAREDLTHLSDALL
jgi:hypothetical protein